MLKEILEAITNPLAEARLDDENKILRSVGIFGSRQSDNGYEYSNKAVDTLTRLASGTKVYLNHQSRSEMSDREGVRNILDWAGVIQNPRRQGDKVVADFHARGEMWPMVKDVATLLPEKVGFSINSKVWTTQENGKETIADIHTLHSVDFVASGATIQNLFESTKTTKEPEKIKGTIIQIRESEIVIDVGESEPLYVEKKKLSFIPREGQDITLTYGGTKKKQESKIENKPKKEVENMPTLTKEAMRGLESLGRREDEKDFAEAVLDAAATDRSPQVQHTYDYLPEKVENNVELTEKNLLGAVTKDEGIHNKDQTADQVDTYRSAEATWEKRRLELKMSGKPKANTSDEDELLAAVTK